MFDTAIYQLPITELMRIHAIVY